MDDSFTQTLYIIFFCISSLTSANASACPNGDFSEGNVVAEKLHCFKKKIHMGKKSKMKKIPLNQRRLRVAVGHTGVGDESHLISLESNTTVGSVHWRMGKIYFQSIEILVCLPESRRSWWAAASCRQIGTHQRPVNGRRRRRDRWSGLEESARILYDLLSLLNQIREWLRNPCSLTVPTYDPINSSVAYSLRARIVHPFLASRKTQSFFCGPFWNKWH